MYTLPTAEAIQLVRRNIDELMLNPSDMLGEDIDARNFEELVRMNLPEAINAVHRAAPHELLDGCPLLQEELSSVEIDDEGVVSFSLMDEMLRLVMFKAVDSPVILTETVPEYSAVGRMQYNIYTRASHDRPRLVQLQRKPGNAASSFRYYTLHGGYHPESYEAIERFEYLPRYRAQRDTYQVAEAVVENVIDYLTSMVLSVYGSESAQYFLTKASFTAPAEAQQ